MAIPAAIVLSSVILATGVYLGLQRAQATPAAPAVAPPVASPVQPAIAPSTPVAPPNKPLPAEVRARGTDNARLALEAMRDAMVRTCWTPLPASPSDPPQVQLKFSVSFSPQGERTALGISEIRGATRPGVADCLRKMALDPKIPPPGGFLQADVPFTLP